MSLRYPVILLIGGLLSLLGCGERESAQVSLAPETAQPVEAAAPEPFRTNPEFGGVQSIETQAVGYGMSQEAAFFAALDNAVTQVNGRRTGSARARSTSSFNVDLSGIRGRSIESSEFVQLVASATRGAVTSYSVVELEQVPIDLLQRTFSASGEASSWFDVRTTDSGSFSRSTQGSVDVQESASVQARVRDADGRRSGSASGEYARSTQVDVGDLGDFDRQRSAQGESGEEERLRRFEWRATIRAMVAQFQAPDSGKPKLVVAPTRTTSIHYSVGDNQISAAEVGGQIQSAIIDTLTQSGRFEVLGRDFSLEMQREIDFLSSDSARAQDVVRLGQQYAADLIMVTAVERFEYPRRTQQLRASDRQLVSYAGGGRVSVRVMNAATGAVISAETFDIHLPTTEPTTMPQGVDGRAIAQDMTRRVSSDIGAMVVRRVFPISVVALQGESVVLSQGGTSVRLGERYNAVMLGGDITDPQTGRSLGRIEIPCCIIRVDRVADQTSYGTIEGPVPLELAQFRPGQVELRGLSTPPPIAREVSTQPTSRQAVEPARENEPAPPPQRPRQNDDDW